MTGYRQMSDDRILGTEKAITGKLKGPNFIGRSVYDSQFIGDREFPMRLMLITEKN